MTSQGDDGRSEGVVRSRKRVGKILIEFEVACSTKGEGMELLSQNLFFSIMIMAVYI